MWLSPLYSCFNIIVAISILFQVTNVRSKEEQQFQNLSVSNSRYIKGDDDFDVTTVYKISSSLLDEKKGDGFRDENFGSTYDGKYSIELHSKTNAIGLLPSNEDVLDYLSDSITPSSPSELFKDNKFIKLKRRSSHWKYKFINSLGYYCNSNPIHRKGLSGNNTCFAVFDYSKKDVHINNKSEILNFEWQQQNDMNSLSIIYIFNKNVYFDIEIGIYDENNQELYNVLTLNTDTGVSQLVIKNKHFYPNNKYKIMFFKKRNYDRTDTTNMTSFSIVQIANHFQTSDNEIDARIINGIFPKIIRPSPFNVFGTNSGEINNTTDSSTGKCLNGGYQLKDRCICLPGFQGDVCEKGCGKNSFGANCDEPCSMFTQGCRGMYFCTMNYGCTCPAGLTGRFCDEECPSDKYGADCNQNCSSNCFENKCDPYTGKCSLGCIGGFKPPNCIEKYTANLINKPKLISAEQEMIKVEIDFGSENMYGLNEITKVKYYNLYWKVSGETVPYSYSKIKLLNTYNKTEEIINNLKPGTIYDIGVLLITEDGNYNEKDIVFGQFRTECQQLDKSDYKPEVIIGLKNISVTWNAKLYTNQQCRITEISLKLNMLNHERKNITQTYNVRPSLDQNNFTIRDLIPGYEYSLKSTLKTPMGILTTLHSTFTPKLTDDDITLENITATFSNKNRTINISWKHVVNSFGLQNLNVNKPFAYTVKYKINRIFSCSLDEKKNEWSSTTVHDATDYDINDVIPNSQYIIQVIKGSKSESTVERQNTIYVLTPASLPELEPEIIGNNKHITNQSAIIKWKINELNCSKINGMFARFVLKLKNINDCTEYNEETEQNNQTFNDLKPDNSYQLKIFIKNNVGYSEDRFLEIKFNTNPYGDVYVNELAIYKRSVKNQKLGLRWSYPTNKTFFIYVISDQYEPLNVITITPEFCTAWPKYYCHTISNFKHTNNFRVHVMEKLDHHENIGPDVPGSVVCCNHMSNKVPDSPRTLSATDVGNTTITLQWDIPWMFNGELKLFIINVHHIKSVTVEQCCNEIDPVEIEFENELPTYNYMLKNLQPGSTYNISVVAESIIGKRSPETFTEVKTNIL